MAFPLKDIQIKHTARLFWIAASAWFVLDQAVKIVERLTMQPGQSIALIPQVFHLTYIRNNGAAFSSFSGQTWLFFTAALVAIAAIFMFWRFEKPTTLLPALGSSLLISGAMGNVVDRIIYGHVTDIFDARFLNFAIFNVADIGITVGAIMLVVWLIFFGGILGEENSPELEKSSSKKAKKNSKDAA